jgi:hypothetical protein
MHSIDSDEHEPDGPDRPDQSASFAEFFGLSLAASAVAGAVAGFVWGGIGGRIAMRVVFLTSNDSVRGVTSDDGFEIGIISGETMALLILTTVFGGFAGVAVGLVRPFLAGRTSAVAAGLGSAVALAAGSVIVHADGIDFRFLDPLWLTVGLFVFLPGAWGATVVLLGNRLVARFRGAQTLVAPPWLWTAVAAWAAVGVIGVLGAIDLVGDIDELRRLR